MMARKVVYERLGKAAQVVRVIHSDERQGAARN
jgi:hypothetical protein